MELNENLAIKEIQEVFASKNESQIHDTISYIHENGSIKMLPLLFELLENTTSNDLKNDIYNCMADTKDSNAVPLFAEALQNPALKKEKNRLLATIWQTNLDFSEYAEMFADILLKDGYETAVEAFTVLEICSETMAEDKKSRIRNVLENGLTAAAEKTTLIQEAIHLFE